MGYSDTILRVEMIANGFCVECYEPKPRSKGKKSDMSIPYEDPWKEYAFKTSAEVAAFVKSKLPELMQSAAKEYDSAFEEAASYMDED